ncbi:MAG: SAM-dependent methyltransferase [Bacteroidota bacterium]
MKLFLIPNLIAENTYHYLPPIIKEIIEKTTYYLVENEKSARRFISSLGTNHNIRDLQFFRLDKRTKANDLVTIFEKIPSNRNVGVISEAGCPGIADPGAIAVAMAHTKNIPVIALPGPSSIFLALMSSGFSGQQFAFHGYIPNKNPEKNIFLKRITERLQKNNETQIFMETPYRNEQLLKDLLQYLSPETQLCIAANLTAPDQIVKTFPVKLWKRQKPKLHKLPTIFLIGNIGR